MLNKIIYHISVFQYNYSVKLFLILFYFILSGFKKKKKKIGALRLFISKKNNFFIKFVNSFFQNNSGNIKSNIFDDKIKKKVIMFEKDILFFFP